MSGKPTSLSSEVATLLRRCLQEGSDVEIEGLGAFRTDDRGRWRFVPDRRPQVFVAYVIEDRDAVDRLCQDLEQRGFEPWMDRRNLLPGQNWPRAIERAIDMSRFFIGCLSKHSVSKRGAFQAELRYALDCARLMPLDDTYLIPVRFDDCQVPHVIRRDTQYVDLFPDWERGVDRIAEMARRQLGG
ncbi:MAG: toll/interleukin-1 receptor domain-containing protein [Bryobacteraceae bacterium]